MRIIEPLSNRRVPISLQVRGLIAIREKRSQLPWLGAPIQSATPTLDGKGWYQHFANGSVYWSAATGAHEVHGAIRDKWASLGWELSFLGYPATDEAGTSDGRGRFNHFQNGSIYWSATSGAWEVHGAIRDQWATLGWERSFLGFPVCDEQVGPGTTRVSRFERGEIAWSPARGAGVSFASYDSRVNGGLKPLGLGSGGVPEVRRFVTVVAHMDLIDDETFGSNEFSSADERREVVVTNFAPQELIKMSDGAGGELRVELALDVQARSTGDVSITGKASLFEGTSETSNDLDGDDAIQFIAPRDGFVSKKYVVVNEDEGGDQGTITLSVANFPA
jgi:hypothetical protein